MDFIGKSKIVLRLLTKDVFNKKKKQFSFLWSRKAGMVAEWLWLSGLYVFVK